MSKKRPISRPAADADAPDGATGLAELSQGLRRHRRELTFLVLFLAILAGSFTFLSLQPVNDRLIEPFTTGVATASGVFLDLLGQDIDQQGTILRNSRFAVNIRNGCNGVETMVIFLAAVLAFPAPWKARGLGLLLGVVVIQAVNLIRVAALFLTGAYFPEYFDSSHTVVWQTLVIAVGVFLWIFWADRVVLRKSEPEDPTDGPKDAPTLTVSA